MKRYIPILLIPIIGCAKYGNHYNVMIDPAFSYDQQSETIAALDGWERNVGGTLSFDTSIGHCNMTDDDGLICIHSSTYIGNILKSNTPNPLGWTVRDNNSDSADCWIATDEVSKDWLRPYFYRLLQHEVGHAMGLAHTPISKHTIMCFSVSCEPEDVVCDDVAQWASLRGWNVPCK